MRVLKNKTKQPQVFNLDSPFFFKNVNATGFNKPVTLSFLALERQEVEDTVMSCACIQKALDDGILRDITPAAKKEEAKQVFATAIEEG